MSGAMLLRCINKWGPLFGDAALSATGGRLEPIKPAQPHEVQLLIRGLLGSSDPDARRNAARPLLTALAALVEGA